MDDEVQQPEHPHRVTRYADPDCGCDFWVCLEPDCDWFSDVVHVANEGR